MSFLEPAGATQPVWTLQPQVLIVAVTSHIFCSLSFSPWYVLGFFFLILLSLRIAILITAAFHCLATTTMPPFSQAGSGSSAGLGTLACSFSTTILNRSAFHFICFHTQGRCVCTMTATGLWLSTYAISACFLHSPHCFLLDCLRGLFT